MVPDWRLGGMGHPWRHGLSYVFIDLCAKFSSLAWLEVCQEPPILEVHTWRMLMAPDWRLGGWGHPWCHGSSYVIFYLCTKFHLSSMIRIVLTTTPSWKSILGGHWRFLTGVLEDWIILNMLDHFERLPGTYHESFMKIWLHLDELEGFEKKLIDTLR